MLEKATFGAGCFWGVEAKFRALTGVKNTQVGYAGGRTENPTYKDVCSDETGHAEVVEVEFESEEISYQDLLSVFWEVHDPTQINRQGPDIGTQYRTVIFFHTPAQKQAAEQAIADLEKSGQFKRSIATQVVAAPKFYRAEEYHQQYLEKRGLDVCHV